MTADPFDAAALRAGVLDAWAGSPTRFREDANAEEDLVRGGYRDRLFVELIQNGLDACAPDPARIKIVLGDDVVLVANTGRPLTAQGVTALASLRASAKRDDEHAVGRFGVGFAAVLAVSDAPMVVSTTGAVAFSAGRTRSLVGSIPGLGAELTRRDGGVPVLRLPFEVDEVPPDAAALLEAGWTTVVRLPLRNAAATDLARTLLAELDPVLPLMFVGLERLELPDRTIAPTVLNDGDVVVENTRWRIARRSGRRHQHGEGGAGSWWTLTAAPVDADGSLASMPAGVRAVLRAPQETQEPHSFPLILAGSFTLDPDRRQLREDDGHPALIHELALTVCDLVARLAPHPASLEVLPGGMPVGRYDGELREEVEDLLRSTPMFPGPDGPSLTGPEVHALDLGNANSTAYPVLVELGEPFLPPLWPPAHRSYRPLGVRTLDTRRLVEWLVETYPRPEPSWWARLAEALVDAPDHDALGGLPVPLADGSFAIGPRGVIASGPTLDLSGLASAGVELKVLHPSAASAGWIRLGVVAAEPTAILHDDRLAAAVAEQVRSLREDDVEPSPELSECVLTLVASGGATDDITWLGDVVLTADDGSAWPARDLLMPDTPLQDLIEDPVVVGAALVDRHGPGALAALGVADRFSVITLQQAIDDDLIDEDDIEQWAAQRGPIADLRSIAVIRDLDLVRADRWPQTLQLLASDRECRLAIMHSPEGHQSFPAWQINRLALIEGRTLNDFCVAVDSTISGIFPLLPADIDVEFAAALGVHTTVDDVVTSHERAWDLLDRLGDEDAIVSRGAARDLYSSLAGALDSSDGEPPLRVRAVVNGELAVVATKEAVILDRPDLIGLIGERPYVPVALSRAPDLARLLRVPLASKLGTYRVVSSGTPAEAGGHRYRHHDPLEVCDADGEVCSVSWFVADLTSDGSSGTVHATGIEGLGKALAYLSRQWSRRDEVVASLREPSVHALQLAEQDVEELTPPR